MGIYDTYTANDADVWPERFHDRDEDVAFIPCDTYKCKGEAKVHGGMCEACEKHCEEYAPN